MKNYIGTKIINARPMNRLEYNEFRGWTLPADENGADEGYLVEYVDGGAANTTEYAGYVSWSPNAQFEGAYRETTGLTLGLAIEALKMGKKVARAGWNGKGMFAYLVHANAYPSQTGVAKSFFGDDALVPYNSYIALKGSDNTVSTWAPSCSDALADDWMIV